MSSAHGMIIRRNGVAIAELRDVTPPVLSRDALEQTTHLEDDDEYDVDERHVGDMNFDVGFLFGDDTHEGILAALSSGSEDLYELEFPDGSIWQFDGRVIGIGPEAPVDGGLVAHISVQPSGSISFESDLIELLLVEDGSALLLETGGPFLLE